MAFHRNKVALVYDFDGTLSPQAMQHYGVLPELAVTPEDFWADVKRTRKAYSAEELLVYMKKMIDIANFKAVKLNKDAFARHGQTIEFFAGVENWFTRINEFVKDMSCGQVRSSTTSSRPASPT